MIADQYVVTSVSAGYYHVCVGTLDDANLCYGKGQYGELGNGESTSTASDVVYTVTGYEGTYLPTPQPTPLPTPVPTTNRTRSTIGVPYAGYETLHVLDDDGGLWCVMSLALQSTNPSTKCASGAHAHVALHAAPPPLQRSTAATSHRHEPARACQPGRASPRKSAPRRAAARCAPCLLVAPHPDPRPGTWG